MHKFNDLSEPMLSIEPVLYGFRSLDLVKSGWTFEVWIFGEWGTVWYGLERMLGSFGGEEPG